MRLSGRQSRVVIDGAKYKLVATHMTAEGRYSASRKESILTLAKLPELVRIPAPVRPLLERYWERLVEREDELALTADQRLSTLVHQNPAFAAELGAVWSASDYVANLCVMSPQLVVRFAEEGKLERSGREYFAAELAGLLAPLEQSETSAFEPQLKAILRRYQQQQMLRIIWRDVCGKGNVADICADISALADAQLDAALDQLHRHCVARWGEPQSYRDGRPQCMAIIGMGKLGAYELNLSSDIDLIFAYPEAGFVAGTKDTAAELSNQQFFTRLGQKLIDTLETVTSDGFVYRVDMRLRPYGSEGALVCSFDAMENYYQSQGRDWERYALIKARAVAGDRQAGAELLTRLRPFVYRRYLDFSAFEALRSMKMQINKQVRRKGLEQDIKLGSGGIREVEFIIQALQLVHGGRDQRLQEPSLYRAMAVVEEAGYLPPETVAELAAAYTFLRSLEHKLQGLANKQTQMLVKGGLEQQRIACAMGFPDWTAMLAELKRHRGLVAQHFAEVIRTDDEDPDNARTPESLNWEAVWRQEMSAEKAREFLAEHGFEDAEQTLAALEEFRLEKSFVTLQGEGRSRFDRFMPVLLEGLSRSPNPGLGFRRVMLLISAVSRRTAYLVLLLENPHALRQVIQLCTASPFVAEHLSKHPVLLDELLDGIDEPPVKARLQEELAQQLLRIDPDDFEEQMDLLRYFKQSHTLQVAAAQITGRLTVMKVSDYLTFTAEAILEQVLALGWDFLVRKHGYPVNTQGEHGEMDFVVVGYGKLGGIELSYVSDLDLVFLHDGALDADTVVGEGQRALNSREFYTRLAQRVITMLGTYTMSGKLYEVDTRLRPSGESGLLVSSMEAFIRYQDQDAWTWEHQALVRARAVAGSARLQSQFDDVRRHTLSRRREFDRLGEDVRSMRQRMRDEFARKPAPEREKISAVIKHGRGGIIDIEFIVQFLVLAYGADQPAMVKWSDNVRILESARDCGLLQEDRFQTLTAAYLEQRALLHEVALAQEDKAGSEALALHQEAVDRVWRSMFPDPT